MRWWTICLIAALCGCGPRRPPSVRIDPALATLVPADAVLLAGVRMEALRATPLYRKLGPPASAFADTGIDLDKVWEILAVSNGRRTAILARGKFSDAGMEPRIDIPGATRSTYRGCPLTATDSLAVAFVNPSTAVAGQPDAVRAILDERGRSNGPSQALERQIDQIPPENQIWAVGVGSAELARAAPRRGNLANFAVALRLMESFRIAADVGTGVRIAATALCRKQEDAQSLSGALRFFAVLAGLNGTSGVRIELRGNEVRIDASVAPEVADRLAAQALQR
jgi:hypothetical protein